MPGTTLGVGETNVKRGAVQYVQKRIDGVIFAIPAAAGVSQAPIGSIVTLQENPSGGQKIVLGAGALTDASGLHVIIAVGFLEASAQANFAVNQTPGVHVAGDIVAMVSDIFVVAAVPMLTGFLPVTGNVSYITPAGLLTLTAAGNVAFPGVVFFGTQGQQQTGQLKTGYCYARLSKVMIGA